jgi:hypothetical protein
MIENLELWGSIATAILVVIYAIIIDLHKNKLQTDSYNLINSLCSELREKKSEIDDYKHIVRAQDDIIAKMEITEREMNNASR